MATWTEERPRAELAKLVVAADRRGPASPAPCSMGRAAGRKHGTHVLWLVTTNDNLDALRLYQRHAFRITELRAGAVDAAREPKPQIPRTAPTASPSATSSSSNAASDRPPAPPPFWRAGSRPAHQRRQNGRPSGRRTRPGANPGPRPAGGPAWRPGPGREWPAQPASAERNRRTPSTAAPPTSTRPRPANSSGIVSLLPVLGRSGAVVIVVVGATVVVVVGGTVGAVGRDGRRDRGGHGRRRGRRHRRRRGHRRHLQGAHRPHQRGGQVARAVVGL